jgi:hypothetical protein
MRVEEIQNLALIGKVRRGGKKGGLERGQMGKEEESESSNQGKKDLKSHKCFRCHKMGHYASQCPKKKKAKQ